MRISDWSSDVGSSDLIDLDRSTVGGVRIFPSTAAMAFARGLVRVDTMRVETTSATLTAAGMLSLAEPRPDSLRYTIVVRSEARRVGKGGVSTCSSGWSPYL